MAVLSKSEMSRREAYVMLFRCYIESIKDRDRGDAHWPKGAFETDVIEKMIEDEHAEDHLGGVRLTEAGIAHWKRHIGGFAPEVKRASTNATKKELVVVLYKNTGWVNAKELPGYIPHSSWSSLIRNQLWRNGLIDKRSARKGKEVEFMITPKGKKYVEEENLIKSTTPELEHEYV